MRNKKFRVTGIHIALLFIFSSILYSEPLEKIAKKLSEGSAQLKNKKVAVLPFSYHDGRESTGSTIISERLITKIATLKKLEVVERSLLEKVFKELKLQSSGAVDDSSAKELGKVLGVEAIVSGTLIDLDQEDVEVNARLIKAETGEIVVAASGEVERFWKEEANAKTVSSEKSVTAGQPIASASLGKEPTLVLSNRDMAGRSRPMVPPPFEGGSPMGMPPEPAMEPPMEEHEGDSSMPQEGFSSERSPDLWSKGVWFGPIDSILVESNVPWEMVRSPMGKKFIEGMRLLKNGESQAALKHFSALEELNRERPAISNLARIGRSMALFQEGKSEEAIHELNSIVQESSAPRVRATAYFALGRVYENLGKSDLAKQNYLEVIRLIPYRTLMVRHASRQLRVLRGESVPPFRNEEANFSSPALYDGPPHFRRPNFPNRARKQRIP